MSLHCIVMAAGKGTRLRSQHSKMLVPIDGRPLVTHVVGAALGLKDSTVVVVVGHQGTPVRRAIEAAFPGAPVRFVTQREQRGTGHAVATAMRAVRGKTGDVLILSGDVPLISRRTLSQLHRLRAGRSLDLALLTMVLEDPGRYGRVVREGRRVRQVVEFLDADEPTRAVREVNAGIYAVDLAFLRRSLRKLRSDNAQGEVYLTDLVALADRGQGAAARSCDPAEVQGLNTWAEQADLEREVRRRVANRWMARGVRLEAPERLVAHSTVRVGADSVLGPDLHLTGDTRIGRECRLDSGVVLHDCRLGPRVHIRPYCVLEGVSIPADSVVGPYAHLSGRDPGALPVGFHPYSPTGGVAKKRRQTRRRPAKGKGKEQPR